MTTPPSRQPTTGAVPVHPTSGPWHATPAQHFTTMLFSVWLVVGIFLDGWAHTHLGEALETFFTPWHAVFYSGFLASAAWVAWLHCSGGRGGRRGLQRLPVGYAQGAAGVLVFAVGGLGDLTWHSVFGIEVGIDALLSPTHLLLFLGAELLVLSPLVACWRAPGARRAAGRGVWPAVLSMTVALSFASFMHLYAWAPVGLPSATGYDGAGHFVLSVLLTGLFLMAPVLLLLRRWQLPFGAVALMYAVNTLLMRAMTVGADGLAPSVLLAGASGLAADLLILWWRPSPGRWLPYRAFAAALPLLFWVPFFLLSGQLASTGASLELWTGACVMTALGGLALSVLIVPPALPEGAQG